MFSKPLTTLPIRLGHAAANAGSPIGLDAKPARMCHICKSMQKAVQNTATCLLRLLAIIGINGPLLFSSRGPIQPHSSHLSQVHSPVVAALGAADSQDGGHPDGTMVHRQGGYRYHKDGQYRGPFLRRVHRALMMLGPWEGRIVAFVLGAIPVLYAVDSIIGTNGTFSMVGCGIGVLLRMFWVMAVLLVRGTRGEPEHEETIFVCAEEVVPIYSEIDEKKQMNSENGD
jgi:hypothetical protein